jgi:hypothetical protein
MPTEADNNTAEIAPVEADERFHVHDKESANWVVRKIVETRAYRERVARWAEAETLRAERQEQFLLHRFGAELEQWARQQIGKQYPRRRSVRLPAGVLGFRNTLPKLIVTDESKLTGWCRKHLPGALKVIERVLKSEVRNHMNSTGEIADGTEVTDGGEKFFVR